MKSIRIKDTTREERARMRAFWIVRICFAGTGNWVGEKNPHCDALVFECVGLVAQILRARGRI